MSPIEKCHNSDPPKHWLSEHLGVFKFCKYSVLGPEGLCQIKDFFHIITNNSSGVRLRIFFYHLIWKQIDWSPTYSKMKKILWWQPCWKCNLKNGLKNRFFELYSHTVWDRAKIDNTKKSSNLILRWVYFIQFFDLSTPSMTFGFTVGKNKKSP